MQLHILNNQNNSRKFSRTLIAAFVLAAASAVTPAHAALNPPSRPDLTDGTDSSNWTDNVTNFKRPTFTGTALPLVTVKLFAGTYEMGSGITDAYGKWSITPKYPMSDGVNAVSAKQVVGNLTSASSPALGVTIDSVKPEVSRPDLTDGSDSGLSYTDNTTNLANPVMVGTGTPRDKITLYTTSGLTVGSATIDIYGNWSVKTKFPVGGTHTYVLMVQASDIAGNIAQSPGGLAFTIDQEAPATPSTPDMAAASDSGASNSDNKTNVGTPTYTVNAEPFAKVILNATGDLVYGVGSATANASGVASIVSGSYPGDGQYPVRAIAYDKAGNSSKASIPLVVVINRKAPAIPGAPGIATVSDGGVWGDGLTNIKTPTLQGTGALPYKLVAVHLFAGIFHYNMSTYADKNGAWSVASLPLPDGVYEATAKVVDNEGNVSTSAISNITIDTVGPKTAPAAPDLWSDSDLGVSSTDNITSATNMTVGGTGPAGGFMQLFNYGTAIRNINVNAGGQWKTELLLDGGNFALSVIEYDDAGNPSPMSAGLFGLQDLEAPTVEAPTSLAAKTWAPLVGSVQDYSSNDEASDVDKVTVQFKRNSDGAVWSGYGWDPANKFPVPAIVSGNAWTASTSWLPKASNIIDGTYTVTAFAYDKSGNQSAPKNFTYTIDNAAPVVTIDTPVLNSVGKTFASAAGTAADALSGAARVNLTLRRNKDSLYWDGAAWVAAKTPLLASLAANGYWSKASGWPTGSNLPDGSYNLTAQAADNAGNGASASRNFTISAGVNAGPDTPVTRSLQSGNTLSTSSADIAARSLTLVFAGSLDSSLANDASRYSVSIGGVELPIANVAVTNGGAVQLILVDEFMAGETLDVSYDLLAANGNPVVGKSSIVARVSGR